MSRIKYRQMVDGNGKQRRVHAVIAERALGRPLKGSQQVHHFNGNHTDNDPSNLVICPDYSYHALLHSRMRAAAACGHANWRSCHFCKRFDDPTNLVHQKNGGYHHAPCAAAYVYARWLRTKKAA